MAEQKKNRSKRSTLGLILLILIVLIASGAFLWAHTPHLLYRAKLRLESLTRQNPLKLADEALQGPLSLEDILKDERTHYHENLRLINPSHPLKPSDTPKLVEYRESGVLMSPAIVEDYGRLSDDIRAKFDVPLYVMSSYRSYEDQAAVQDQEGDFATAPGASEHQTGLALDLYVYQFAGPSFIKHEAGRYINDHASDYGFIIRYPLTGERSTGIPYEPWHLRYLGQPHAKIISESGLTMEEYVDSLEPGTAYRYGPYLILRQRPENLMTPSNYRSCDISPDHTGHYILSFGMAEGSPDHPLRD